MKQNVTATISISDQVGGQSDDKYAISVKIAYNVNSYPYIAPY
jgi:hypothetical protein